MEWKWSVEHITATQTVCVCVHMLASYKYCRFGMLQTHTHTGTRKKQHVCEHILTTFDLSGLSLYDVHLCDTNASLVCVCGVGGVHSCNTNTNTHTRGRIAIVSYDDNGGGVQPRAN